MTKKHFGIVKQGKFIPDDREQFTQAFKPLEDTRVEVTVQKYRKSRSLQQNAYYWGVLIDILANYTGYEPDEMHDALRWQFLRVHRGNGLPDTVKSTTALTTAEFEEYLEKVRRWAATDHSVYVPEPNEVETWV